MRFITWRWGRTLLLAAVFAVGMAQTAFSREAQPDAAVKALGIDIAMFAEKESGGDSSSFSYSSYFAASYQLTLGTLSSWGGVNVGIGSVLENGMFFENSIDFGKYYYRDNPLTLFGCGLSLGKVHDLGNKMQIAYGGSGGYWWVLADEESRNSRFYYLAPFVRWRVSFFELTYKWLFGSYDEHKEKNWFDCNSHQLMLGVKFGSSKRVKVIRVVERR